MTGGAGEIEHVLSTSALQIADVYAEATLDLVPDNDAAESVVARWRKGADVLDVLRDYGERLRRFGDAHDLGFYDAGHGEVATLADRHDVVYKPCGAGGGDVGIAFAAHEDAINRMTGELASTGFVPLSLALDARGIVVES